MFTDEAPRQSQIAKGVEKTRPYSREKSAQERFKVFEEVAGS